MARVLSTGEPSKPPQQRGDRSAGGRAAKNSSGRHVASLRVFASEAPGPPCP